MALPVSGAVSLTQIQTEFGGANPIGISEYYAGGAYVPAGTSGTNGAVPSSGAISINSFYGTSNVLIVEYVVVGGGGAGGYTGYNGSATSFGVVSSGGGATGGWSYVYTQLSGVGASGSIGGLGTPITGTTLPLAGGGGASGAIYGCTEYGCSVLPVQAGGYGGGGSGGVGGQVAIPGSINTGAGGGGIDQGNWPTYETGKMGNGGNAGTYRSSVVGQPSGGGGAAESRLTLAIGSGTTVTIGAGGSGVYGSGAGGSGIVIVRYAGAQRATGGTITSAGGYTIHKFTTSGTFTVTG